MWASSFHTPFYFDANRRTVEQENIIYKDIRINIILYACVIFVKEPQNDACILI